MSEPRTSETLYVTIPATTALLIRQAFVPMNPNKMRNAHPDVVTAAHEFIAAVGMPKPANGDLKRLRDGIKALQAQCCGSDDPCNGCRALLGLLKDSP